MKLCVQNLRNTIHFRCTIDLLSYYIGAEVVSDHLLEDGDNADLDQASVSGWGA